MNNINCEHCGTLIDVTKEIRCPNCGAPYKNNKQYKEYLEYQKRQKELNLETHQMINNTIKNVNDTTQKIFPGIFIIPIVLMIICIFTFGFISFQITSHSNIPKENDDPKYFYPDVTSKEPVKIDVDFNEKAVTDEYDIMVDKVVKYVEKNYTLKNETYYGFHIVFNNKTNKWQTLNNIRLSYLDENGNTKNVLKSIVSTEELDFFAKYKQEYEGYLYYFIPSDIKDVIITYENVTINIANYKDNVK